MSQPFIGEIRLLGFSFPPAGWALCNGQLLPISENDALFNLIGTTYGGDGQETFGLPDLRGRVPVHTGSGFVIGQMAGTEAVTLLTSQVPVHTHGLVAAGATGTSTSPLGNVPAQSLNVTPYINDVTTGAMAATAIAQAGGSQPHENMQPFLTITYAISLFGVFPSQN